MADRREWYGRDSFIFASNEELREIHRMVEIVKKDPEVGGMRIQIVDDVIRLSEENKKLTEENEKISEEMDKLSEEKEKMAEEIVKLREELRQRSERERHLAE